MFRQLEYQERVLNRFDEYLDALRVRRDDAISMFNALGGVTQMEWSYPDFPREAWSDLRAKGGLPEARRGYRHSSKSDGCDRPVPNIVYKVPTGGGKTWLAISSISRILGRYLGTNTGLVLWVVPSEAIYMQTIKNLKNRQHPYRQQLDRSAMGRVKILEKSDSLNLHDIESNLCIMLLMLQSANRETRETLRMFQDRGDVRGFFPSEGNQEAHRRLINQVENLDCYDGAHPLVKNSLGNALRSIQPVVVLDEGHKAMSELAYKTLYGFNPCFVLELTATPRDIYAKRGMNPGAARFSNVLVEVSGRELDNEGMIKMPLNLETRQSSDWKSTLGVALRRLNDISKSADKHLANTGVYIRPMLIVQVERTGIDQRDAGFIHSDEVREYLLSIGYEEGSVAIKSSDRDDLRNPGNDELLSPKCRVKIIVTKQALQEGWDCPFAYVLCSLCPVSNKNAMTQLIGRILRQPYAMKSGVAELDECYVIAHHANTEQTVNRVKHGLEREGLGDLTLSVTQLDENEDIACARIMKRREKYRHADIFLPKVNYTAGGRIRELDYETDVMSQIDWKKFNTVDAAQGIDVNVVSSESLRRRIDLKNIGRSAIDHGVYERISAGEEFNKVQAVKMMHDLVPNAFVGYEIVSGIVAALNKMGHSLKTIGEAQHMIIEQVRTILELFQLEMAEEYFKEAVRRGDIQFRLRVDGKNWQMPATVKQTVVGGRRHMTGKFGGALENSLFETVYEDDMNEEEREVAVYLDGSEAIHWWHRNVAKQQYGIQGWKKSKVYPDFIFAVRRDGANETITVLETKGDYLDNMDTEYKRNLLEFLSTEFCWEDNVHVGQLEMVRKSGAIVNCELILMSEWKRKLAAYLMNEPEPSIVIGGE